MRGAAYLDARPEHPVQLGISRLFATQTYLGGSFLLLENKQMSFSRERTKQVEECVLNDGHPKGKEIEAWLKVSKKQSQKGLVCAGGWSLGGHKLMKFH